jgi:hypothetical protein
MCAAKRPLSRFQDPANVDGIEFEQVCCQLNTYRVSHRGNGTVDVFPGHRDLPVLLSYELSTSSRRSVEFDHGARMLSVKVSESALDATNGIADCHESSSSRSPVDRAHFGGSGLDKLFEAWVGDTRLQREVSSVRHRSRSRTLSSSQPVQLSRRQPRELPTDASVRKQLLGCSSQPQAGRQDRPVHGYATSVRLFDSHPDWPTRTYGTRHDVRLGPHVDTTPTAGCLPRTQAKAAGRAKNPSLGL